LKSTVLEQECCE